MVTELWEREEGTRQGTKGEKGKRERKKNEGRWLYFCGCVNNKFFFCLFPLSAMETVPRAGIWLSDWTR